MAGKRDNFDDFDFEVMDLSDSSRTGGDTATEEHEQSRQVLSSLHSTAKTQEQRSYQGEHYVSREPLGSAPRPSYKSNSTPRSLSNGTGAPTPQSLARERLSQTQSISMKEIQERLSQTQSISAHEIQERLSQTQMISAQEIQNRLDEQRGLSDSDIKSRNEKRRKEIQKQQKKNKRRTGYVEVHEESIGVELNESRRGMFGWKKTKDASAYGVEQPNNRTSSAGDGTGRVGSNTAAMRSQNLEGTGKISQASKVAAAKAAAVKRAAVASAAAGAEAVSKAAMGKSSTSGYGQGGLMQRHYDNRFDKDVRRGLNDNAEEQRQRQMLEQINDDMRAQVTGRITNEVIEESRRIQEGPQVIGVNGPRMQRQAGVSSATGVIGQRPDGTSMQRQAGVSSATGVIGQRPNGGQMQRQAGVSSATGVIGQRPNGGQMQRQAGVSSATGVIGQRPNGGQMQRQAGVSSATGVIGQRPNGAGGKGGQNSNGSGENGGKGGQNPSRSNGGKGGQNTSRSNGGKGGQNPSRSNGGNGGQNPPRQGGNGKQSKGGKGGSKFKKGVIIQFAAIGAVLIAALVVLWLFLAAYQKSLPEHTMDAVITAIENGDMSSVKLVDADGNALDATSQAAIGEALKAITAGKDLLYKKVSSESDSEKQSYIICTAEDGNLLKSMLERSDEKLGFNLRGWNLVGTTVITDQIEAKTLTVHVPSDGTLLVSGVAASADLKTAEAQEIPILQRCINSGIVGGMPKIDIFTLPNVYTIPKLVVQKADGTTDECVLNNDIYEGGFTASQEFYDANAPRVYEIFNPYAKYFAGDISYYELLNYVIDGSPAANQARQTDVSWMQEHTYVELTEQSVTNMRRYTDDCFACDISFVETIYQGDYAAKTWNTNMTWILVRQNGTFYLADFVNK